PCQRRTIPSNARASPANTRSTSARSSVALWEIPLNQSHSSCRETGNVRARLHFLSSPCFQTKCNRSAHSTVPPDARDKTTFSNQEDCMTNLAMFFLSGGPDEIFTNYGLWLFLSVGAVALFGIFLPTTIWM